MNSVPQPNWWSRNWKWFVPTGCLTLLLAFGAFVFGIATFVFGIMKSSEVYTMAMAQARANPAVVQALGQPIQEGKFVSGSVTETGPSGRAEFAIPLSGPKGEAKLYLVARKSAGQWTFSRLELAPESGGARINLLQEVPAAAPDADDEAEDEPQTQ